MPAWTNATDVERRAPTATHAGVLRPAEFAEHIDLRRWPADADLDPWVENFWGLRWQMPAGRSRLNSVVPHPAVNLTVQSPERAGIGARVVTGIPTRRYDTEVSGAGWVLGVKFRPGGFTALTGVPGGALVDRTLNADPVFPASLVARVATFTPQRTDDEMVAEFGAALGVVVRDVQADPDHLLVLEVVTRMLADRRLLGVGDVERATGLDRRRLQRLFGRYLGVGPKWVLARYRLHDAVAALDAGWTGSLADLAAEHGWYDQAHFARDFTRQVGVPPSTYRDRRGSDGAAPAVTPR